MQTELEDNYFSSNCFSLNVKGIRDSSKRERVFTWCNDKKADVVFLQETYSTVDVEDKWSSLWEGPCYFSHGSNHSKGVLILINSHLDFQLQEVVKDTDGRYIIMQCSINGRKVVLCNVYFPTRNKELEQITFLEVLSREINKITTKDSLIIMGGDFNMIRNFNLDYSGNRHYERHTRFNQQMEEFMEQLNLIDIWRQKKIHYNVNFHIDKTNHLCKAD